MNHLRNFFASQRLFQVLVLSLIGAGAIVARAADAPKDLDPPKTWVVDVVVIDKALGEPIPKLPLSVRIDNRPASYITDDQGRAHIEYPEGLKYISIAPKSDVYVPVILSWNNASGDKRDHVPDAYKLELDHGTAIGGVINDEKGKGIPNVGIELMSPIPRGEEISRVHLYLHNYPVRTDAQGRWRCDVVPKKWEQASIRLRHPDFVSDDNYRSKDIPPMERLRDMTSVMVMSKGIEISGRVLDDNGNPIEKASVVYGRTGYSLQPPEAKTNKDGRFVLTRCRPSQQISLMITAKGRAPVMKPINSDKDVEDVEIKLDPGSVLRLRVVNAKGEPLPGARITTSNWRGVDTLNWRANTDNEGRIVWNEAPTDGVSYGFYQSGYVQAFKSLVATGQEQVITLVPHLKVAGTVVDALTGKAIENFRVVRGWTSTGSRRDPFWDRNGRAALSENGKFEYTESYERDGYAVRIEAEGYLPAESREFKADEGSVSLEFKLKKGTPLVGTLQTPDGKALAEADLVVVSGSSQIFINNGEVGSQTYTLKVKADSTGRFNLPPQVGKFTVMVVHPLGYAELTPEELAKDRVIAIKPWGQIEGTVRIGAKPGANLTLSAQSRSPDRMSVHFDSKAKADEKGHFVIERAVPGATSLGIEVTRPYRGNMSTVSLAQMQKIEVEAGKTFQAEVGGKGRAIIGTVVLPAELTDVDWTVMRANIITKLTVERKLPENWAKLDAAARRKLNEEWINSPEGREATLQQNNRRYYSVPVEPGGAMRLDDVPAGNYELGVSIERAPDAVDRRVSPPSASARLEFTIPEMPGGRSDEPLDLGKIELKMVQTPKQ